MSWVSLLAYGLTKKESLAKRAKNESEFCLLLLVFFFKIRQSNTFAKGKYFTEVEMLATTCHVITLTPPPPHFQISHRHPTEAYLSDASYVPHVWGRGEVSTGL